MPNPVLPRVAREDMPEVLRQGYDTAKEVRGDATFFEIGAHAPEILDW